MKTGVDYNKPQEQQDNRIVRKHTIRICLGSACYSKAKHENLECIETFLKENDLLQNVDFSGHLCIEQCKTGPNVEIDGKMYHEVSPEKLRHILPQHFMMQAE
jgi:NADH:ubiquinone oxidoreductase subunit E